MNIRGYEELGYYKDWALYCKNFDHGLVSVSSCPGQLCLVNKGTHIDVNCRQKTVNRRLCRIEGEHSRNDWPFGNSHVGKRCEARGAGSSQPRWAFEK